MTPREKTEQQELSILSPLAVPAVRSRGRARHEDSCETRTCFQRDVDRITHSKAFRRLIHKTQVFLRPEGDHYRTRMTHTLEVTRIARTVSRALGLNEDLTEAIAMGHDLGHTPFGHAGERALNELMRGHGGFSHNEQSLRVADRIEKNGAGLNLTHETRDGILCHPTSASAPLTMEGRVVRISDRIAYVNHDADDAARAGIISETEIPDEITRTLGADCSARIDALVRGVIAESRKRGDIALPSELNMAFNAFYSFMSENLYRNPAAKSEETKVFGILQGLFGYYADNPKRLPPEFHHIAEEDGRERAVCDYVSGMTDSYAIYKYEELFIPGAWEVRG